AGRGMHGIAIGGEDFAASIKTAKTRGNEITAGRELFVARSLLVLAAKEAGVQAIDSVFSDLRDEEGLIRETAIIKELGFDGKSCVNPRQIEAIHSVFTPARKDIDYAYRVLDVYEEAMRKKSGVVALDGKMIDMPMVTRAKRVLALALAAGIEKENS
ncbi:MAG: HpcH/HpaI aldolase/citrate lyase family protein, partial [Deltaproteobacteria bacterium]|nr:HpcH/HpaI aldolase/citrate lyase family protein [Deltaproteobacteria bacterium]